MKTHKTAGMLAIATATLLLLGGCASPQPPVIETDPRGGQLAVPEIENRESVPWISSESHDESTLRVTFSYEPWPTCERHDIEAVETDDTVTVTLFKGDLPDAERLCASVTLDELPYAEGSMVIELDEPLGDRRVIDGYSLAQEE